MGSGVSSYLVLFFVIICILTVFSGCVEKTPLSAPTPTVTPTITTEKSQNPQSEILSITGMVSPGMNGMGLEGLNYRGEITVTNAGNQPMEFEKVVGGFYTVGEGMQTSITNAGGGVWKLNPGESTVLPFESKGYFLLKQAAEASGHKIMFFIMIIKDGKPLNDKMYTASVPYMEQILSENSRKLPLDFKVSDAIPAQ